MDGEISASGLTDLLDSDADVEIVDIRRPAAFDHGHIPGSRNLPFGRLVDRVDELDGDADRIVTVCPHGESSVQAARLIASYEGIEETPVVSLADGLEGWDGPIENGE
ncbi:rhodanese-like domain-containing protein [Halapricum hydrolyticum]|uniref:Rhodanese-like domain-containing protein n=1 Tax=Halapricum hydrolyticum TaxID=2979991 RepID=A0AAE3IDP9_9EURY|nr:rhodanese-like domain-containing protein [Halapricum hydrolyticum]MCU4719245.1 rhodanese-like domain-containing protein [Halapricum hydrolyticum]MCU4728322.1 rhodanese-like domain-containing protein [Halapricum hydrolyticum]